MNLILSTAPHIRARQTTQKLMLNVVLALLPCAVMGVYYYGLKALMVIAVCVASCVLSEFIWEKCAKKPITVSDCSAVVTGLLLALTITPTTSWWMCIIGSVIAIVVVKQLFGGIGDNFLNPALTARAVLLASWPARLTTHVLPDVFPALDSVTSATPLAGYDASMLELFLGQVPGAIGESCKAAILLGFVILLLTGTITWHIPTFAVIGGVLTAWVLNLDPLASVLSGGLLFGAVFMATDYATCPMHRYAQCVYALLIGVITIIIRKFGAYPEGVTYAILFMNILAPLLDRMMPNHVYGHPHRWKKEAK